MTRFLRFSDLVDRGIVRNWPTLQRLIKTLGFPPGVLLSANARGWDEGEVEAWLASRPIGPKPVPRSPGRHRKTPKSTSPVP
jgi:predicted DNA-binding transcriptional regulator AlpA